MRENRPTRVFIRSSTRYRSKLSQYVKEDDKDRALRGTHVLISGIESLTRRRRIGGPTNLGDPKL